MRDKFLVLDFEYTIRGPENAGNRGSAHWPKNFPVLASYRKFNGSFLIKEGIRKLEWGKRVGYGPVANLYAINSQLDMEVVTLVSATLSNDMPMDNWYSEWEGKIGYKEQHNSLGLSHVKDMKLMSGYHWQQLLSDVHTIIMHNANADLSYLTKFCGIDWDDLKSVRVWDTQMGCYLLSGCSMISPSLEEAAKHAGIPIEKTGGPSDMWEAGYDTTEIPLWLLKEYVEQDVRITFEVFINQITQVQHSEKPGQIRFFTDQMESVFAHSYISNQGINVDTESLLLWKEKTERDIRYLDGETLRFLRSLILKEGYPAMSSYDVDAALKSLNLTGRKLWSDLLFKNQIVLTVNKYTGKYKNGKDKYRKEEVTINFKTPWSNNLSSHIGATQDLHGNYSISESVMQDYLKLIKNGYPVERITQEIVPIIETILAQRKVSKLYNTYILPIQHNLVTVYNTKTKSNVVSIYPNFNTCVTATGRLSSSKPNFQNQFNHQFKEIYQAPPGYTMVEVDYSQLEVLVLALVCEDANLIKLLRAGVDVHSYLFEQINGRQPSKAERKAFKAFSFGLIYGSSANGLVKSTGASPSIVQQFIKTWEQSFPRSEQYAKDIQQLADTDSESMPRKGNKPAKRYFYTMPKGGRTLTFNSYLSEWKQIEEFSWPQMKNYPIQSLASDIVKAMVVSLVRNIVSGGELSGVRIVNTVHDSVILYVPTHDGAPDLDEVLRDIKACLEKVKPWLNNRGIDDHKLPFTVEFAVGPDWYNLKPTEVNT